MTNNKNFYITNNQDLEFVLDLILKAKAVAIDTEFTREKTYYPILSLIQIAVKDAGELKSFIVDGLADIDLNPLFKIIADKKITKILHSSLQDLQIFYQKSNKAPLGVADTQILANFCGFGFNVGYSNLVESFFQKEIDKTQQRSDWQKRPLSQKQIDYALSDVLYLEEMHEKLLEILDEKGRKNWYYEEVKNFTDKAIIQLDEDLFKRFSFKRKTPAQIAQIKKLILWREKWAQKLDLPRQHFLKDEAIERMVVFGDFNFNFDKKVLAEAKAILAEIDEAPKKIIREDADEGRSFFMNSEQKNLYKEAKKLIAEIAREENFKEQFLITSDGLKSVICGYKKTEQLLAGWRYQLFGERLNQLIS